MAWSVISDASLIIVAECQLDVFTVDETEDEACSQFDAVFDVFVVNVEEVMIFVTKGENTCR